MNGVVLDFRRTSRVFERAATFWQAALGKPAGLIRLLGPAWPNESLAAPESSQ